MKGLMKSSMVGDMDRKLGSETLALQYGAKPSQYHPSEHEPADTQISKVAGPPCPISQWYSLPNRRIQTIQQRCIDSTRQRRDSRIFIAGKHCTIIISINTECGAAGAVVLDDLLWLDYGVAGVVGCSSCVCSCEMGRAIGLYRIDQVNNCGVVGEDAVDGGSGIRLESSGAFDSSGT